MGTGLFVDEEALPSGGSLRIMFPILVLQDATSSLGGPDLTRYILVCGLLVLGIAGLGLAFRALFSRTLKARAARRSLQVVDVLPLGGKQRLVVVRCYDRVFLLGQGDKELRSLAELHSDELIPSEPNEQRGAPASATHEEESSSTAPATHVRPSTLEGRPTQSPTFGAELDEALENPVRQVAPMPPRQAVFEDGRGIIG